MMAKKVKAAKVKRSAKKRTQRIDWGQMVIRVKVPRADIKAGMKAYVVTGLSPGGIPRRLEILSAYYDAPGQPNARL